MTAKDPRYSDDNLIWIDMEMTGLQPEVNRIIEVAAIVTDAQLNVLHEGPVIAIHQDEYTMTHMDEWNTNMHTRSGLVKRVLESTVDEEQATDMLLDTFRRFVGDKRSPLCGNTIGQDRRFMARWMPRLEAFFHYRVIDVSSLKELVRRWDPATLAAYKKATRHQALSDIQDSIDELKYYREKVMKI